jgi:hypothetical protein
MRGLDDRCVQLKSYFGYDTFFAVDVRRFGDGGIFIGNLRKHVEEVRPKLEKKIAEAAGTKVTFWFMEEKNDESRSRLVQFESISISIDPSLLPIGSP